jgi:hypothetical protein
MMKYKAGLNNYSSIGCNIYRILKKVNLIIFFIEDSDKLEQVQYFRHTTLLIEKNRRKRKERV